MKLLIAIPLCLLMLSTPGGATSIPPHDPARTPQLLAKLIEQHASPAEIDAAAGQRDASASKLFWYTDLTDAKRAAKQSGKPILSLRLLGRLDEEFSCANSRFFRTTLYPDPKVNALLSEKFVLHWESVRPAPRITIDFGDGRKIERTITGNSIHYVLDSDGRPLDALPGLYSAAEFEKRLNEALTLAGEMKSLTSDRVETELRNWHVARLNESRNKVQEQWRLAARKPLVEKAPAARLAMPIAMSKSGAEIPLLRALDPLADRNVTVWQTIGIANADQIVFAPEVMEMIKSKSNGKPLEPMLVKLRLSIAADTARNEFELHARLHEWFAAPDKLELEPLNDRVYSELFLTPKSDPWLGLAPDDVFAAIETP